MGDFFSYLYLSVFSVVSMFFFYGQKQHLFFEGRFGKPWCTRALRNKPDRKVI
jgi:hypothetical protein